MRVVNVTSYDDHMLINYLGVAAKYRNAVSSPDLQSGSNARA